MEKLVILSNSCSLCCRVNLQSRSAVALRIKAEVVDQQLEIFDMQASLYMTLLIIYIPFPVDLK